MGGVWVVGGGFGLLNSQEGKRGGVHAPKPTRAPRESAAHQLGYDKKARLRLIADNRN